MQILNRFKVHDIISFELHVDSVLPQDYDHVKVIGIVTASVATTLGNDVYAIHSQIYRLLPSGVAEDDATSYQYLLIETTDGQQRVVGLPWIKEDSIRVFTRTIVNFQVTDIAQEDINRIRDVIAQYGYYCTTTIL